MPLAISGLWWWTGHPLRAAIVAAVAGLLAVLLLAGIDLDRLVLRAVEAIGNVLAWLLHVTTILPAWAVTRVLRRDVLRGPSGGVGWRTSVPDQRPAAQAASIGGARRSVAGRLTWAVGAVVVVAALNYGVGWAWDSITLFREDSASAQPDDVDPRVDVPAMADYPWRFEYFEDLRQTPSTYWPFTEYRPLSFRSPHVNIDDWVRRSHEPDTTAEDVPVVWFFGGSTTFGEGQRDLYTIPSWISRIAEDEGTPIRVVNYGQRGWTHYQEMLLLDQLLPREDPPDVAVFLDGANELTAQSLMTEAVPTHTLVLDYARRLSGLEVATAAERADDGDLWTRIREAYAEHSMVHKVADWIGLRDAADAQSAEPDVNRGFDTSADTDGDGVVGDYQITVQDARDAIAVYEQGRALTLTISERHGVEPVLFWQPRRGVGPPERWANDHLTSPTIDITTALDDHQDTYIDGGHTNEEGARVLAEAMWEHLREVVAEARAG